MRYLTSDRRTFPPREQALLAGAAMSCLLAPLAVALTAPPMVSVPIVLTLFCIAPGAALLPFVRGPLEPGLIIATSLGTVLLVAQAMLWLGAWHPRWATYVVSIVCLPPIVAHVLGPRLARDR